METVALAIPAALFAELYRKFGEETGATVERCLRRLLDTAGDTPTEGTPQYPRPSPGTITGRVWEIADRIKQETGEATRDAVVKACMREGINLNTANTQYSHWRNASGS